MKHIALLLFLFLLSALNFLFAFRPELSRRYFRFPQHDTARTLIHVFFGAFFLLCVLMVFYAFLNPRAPR